MYEVVSTDPFKFNLRRYNKGSGKWRAVCKGQGLGYHATEKAAAGAIDNYVKDGVAPTAHAHAHREGSSSQFKGVFWVRRCRMTLSNPS